MILRFMCLVIVSIYTVCVLFTREKCIIQNDKSCRFPKTMYYFVIINNEDVGLYEREWSTNDSAHSQAEMQDRRHLNQLIAHAALDLVDENIKLSNQMYLKRIDKFNEYIVSAFVTAGGIRFLVLHDTNNDDNIRMFFVEVYEAFLKLSMNPLYKKGEKIYSMKFNQKILQIGKRYFS